MRIIKWICDFFSSIAALFYWFYLTIRFGKLKNYIRKVKKDKPVLIFGNGPSLTEDLTHFNLSDYDVCAVNFFANSDLFFKIKPQNYALFDPSFFIDGNERFTSFIDIINKVDWEMNLYVPGYYYKQAKKVIISPTIKLVPVNRTSLSSAMKFKKLRFKMYKRNMASPVFQNVMIGAIFCLINVGYQKIYLLGADHSWLNNVVMDSDNVLCLVDSHFYDNSEGKLNPWRKPFNGESYKYHEILATLAITFEQYQILSDYAKYLGDVSICNVTKSSYIDAFERFKIKE